MRVPKENKAGRFPRRLKHVIWKTIQEKGILLNLESGSYFEVNPVGLAIWKKCDGKAPLEKIVGEIAGQFGFTPEQIQRDLAPFVAELKRNKLLESAAA